MALSRFCSQRGMTFVELLVAGIMMALLFVGLAGHLRGGVRVWQRATGVVEALQRQRVALDQIERDTADALAFRLSGEESVLPAFDPDRIRIWTLMPTVANRAGGVYLVEYFCGSVGGVDGLWRSSRTPREVQAEVAAQTTRLTPDCNSLTMHYAYLPPTGVEAVEWHATWEFPDDIPRLVEAEFRAGGREPVRRMLVIPIGVLKPFPQAPS